MTTRRGYLPREGLYIDPIVSNLRKILHPFFTLTLLYFVQRGKLNSAATPYQKFVQYIAATSVLLWVNDYLSTKSRNNWTIDDAWDWEKELVVVTGGSGGIGAGVAQRLAAMGARVVVVDIISLTYKPGILKLSLYPYGKIAF